MYRLGQKVYVVSDKFEQNLPIGQHAYIIAYERNADNAFDYVIRIPKLNKHYYVPASDIELEEVLLRQEADRIEKEALIDFALATKNQELFLRIMNGGINEKAEQDENKLLSQEEFVKQVNLKAWI
ncbi:ATPase [Ferviditalea candida]|uniref:ATPase n=1 Tax=Ferviditalea candida TaxID=3108399 RepID=A0ABU5ZI13_9BACL|nr:ATPase [Paenibacillaceae bacterium T2]